LENAPLSEDDERSMSRQDEAIFKINDKHHKGELRRQSPFSDGETTIKVADGNQLLKSYDSESFEIQDTLSNRNEKSRLIEQVLALQSTLDGIYSVLSRSWAPDTIILELKGVKPIRKLFIAMKSQPKFPCLQKMKVFMCKC